MEPMCIYYLSSPCFVGGRPLEVYTGTFAVKGRGFEGTGPQGFGLMPSSSKSQLLGLHRV